MSILYILGNKKGKTMLNIVCTEFLYVCITQVICY